MIRDAYEITICSECGAQLEFDRDECAFFPEEVEDCPRERKCGTFPDATSLVHPPGTESITVFPAQSKEEGE